MRVVNAVAAVGLILVVAAACSSGATTGVAGASGPSTSGASTPAARDNAGSVTQSVSTPSAALTSGGKAGACALVTATEAQAAMGGVAASSTAPGDDGIDRTCVYTSADGRNYLQVSVKEVEVSKSDFDQANKSDQEKPVSGVGSDAYFDAATQTLSVWQNNNLLSIQITDESGNTGAALIQAAASKVATTALSRL